MKFRTGEAFAGKGRLFDQPATDAEERLHLFLFGLKPCDFAFAMGKLGFALRMRVGIDAVTRQVFTNRFNGSALLLEITKGFGFAKTGKLFVDRQFGAADTAKAAIASGSTPAGLPGFQNDD